MSEFNSEPIDIIVPWVNPNDPIWKKEFEYWKQKETGNKDSCRYRDWGFLKYVFRSIDENCPWCRYVFLVLSGPSQIPDWLNVNHPKLKIVYHKDYIPAEFLPTFNSNVIEMFYSKIEELSENFILINDDMFFCQMKGEDFFFKNNLPVYKLGLKRFTNIRVGWERALHNSLEVVNKLLNCPNAGMYETFHLPIGYNKTLQQFILTKINLDCMKNDKFRKNNDLTHFLFYDFACKVKKFIKTDGNRGTYCAIERNNFNLNVPLICMNETEHSTQNMCKNAVNALSKKFKNKSGFEK